MSRPHTHKCDHCKTPVECEGELQRNYDGWPEVICSAIHRPSGVTERVLCDACELLKAMCDDLEEPMPKIGRTR